MGGHGREGSEPHGRARVQGRAVADGRLAVGRFADPTVAVLLRPGEREAVDQVRGGVAPDGWADRLEYE